MKCANLVNNKPLPESKKAHSVREVFRRMRPTNFMESGCHKNNFCNFAGAGHSGISPHCFVTERHKAQRYRCLPDLQTIMFLSDF